MGRKMQFASQSLHRLIYAAAPLVIVDFLWVKARFPRIAYVWSNRGSGRGKAKCWQRIIQLY